MNFIGNKKALNYIERTLQKGATSQAYLFAGPENVGKFFLAKSFAKSLVTGKNLSFDENGSVIDIIMIKPEIEEKKGVIKEKEINIETIREARKELSLFPHSGKKKVLIVDNAHKMNIASQNAFLKILEEPNSTSVIIMVTHEDSKILPTIKSRCQRINFGLVKKEDKELERMVGADFMNKHWMMAMGRPGLLLEMSKKKEVFDLYVNAHSEFMNMLGADFNRRLSLAEKMSKDVPTAIITLNIWIWTMRGIALEKEGKEQEDIFEKISSIESTIAILKNTNANARLVIENLLINI